MTRARFINLHQDDRIIRVDVRRSGSFVSPHSGRELREMEGIVQNSSEELHDWFMEVLKQRSTEGIPSSETPGEPGRPWKVSLRQWTQSGTDYSYTIELREVERLEIQELIVDQMRLRPYRYEEVAQDGLRIDAKVEVSKAGSDQFPKVLANPGYFPVVRRGFQEEPREMRFGTVYWSQHENTFKYNFVLVERTPADETPSHPWDLPGANARSHLAFEIALRQTLLQLLVEKGIISEEEITALKERAKLEAGGIENEFYRVTDVDLLP